MALTFPIRIDLGLFYALTSFVCLVIIAIILDRVVATSHRELIDKKLVRLLSLFLCFCFVDFIWGLFESRLLLVNDTGLTVTTYIFFIMAFLVGFIWTGYMIRYVRMEGRERIVANCVRGVLLTAQLGLLFADLVVNEAFFLDANGLYQTSAYRSYLFALQFSYYLYILIHSLLRLRRSAEDYGLQRSAVLFSLLQLFFGLVLLAFPDGPFFTMGFTVTAVAIYSYNITAQRERFAVAVSEAAALRELEETRAVQQEALSRAMEAAEAANNAKSTFLFNMSHDIRTPMNAILGFTEMARKNIDDREKSLDCLEKVELSGEHLLSILNDVLDMSRIESGKVVIEEKPVSLARCGKALMSMAEQLAAQKDIRLVVEDAEPSAYTVYADEMHLDRVFINILSNAIKYTPAGGTVWFTTHSVADEDPDYIGFESVVRDNGIGMAPEFLEHVFEAFARERNTTTSGVEGTGLGMAITKQLVDLMHGDIRIESQQGVGTTVTLFFRFRKAEQVAEERTVEHGQADRLKGRKVLLVEDNELNREIARDVLEELGLIVEEAVDGVEAVEKIDALPKGRRELIYDFVLMDIQMPRMDGFAATAAIRALPDPTDTHLPIIAMTANAFAEDREKARQAGMDAHLAKPIDLQALTDTLLSFLPEEAQGAVES